MSQVQNACLLRARDVEVLVDCLIGLQRRDNAAGDVADVGEAPGLLAVAEDFDRVLAAQDLLSQVRYDMRVAHLVAGEFVYAIRVERPADRVVEMELVREGAAVPLTGELAETVGADRWRDLGQVRFLGGKDGRAL